VLFSVINVIIGLFASYGNAGGKQIVERVNALCEQTTNDCLEQQDDDCLVVNNNNEV